MTVYRPSGPKAALAAALAWLAGTACACDAPVDMDRARPTLSLRADNDMFGGAHQDSGYTNGFQLRWMSANLDEAADPSCQPWLVRGVSRYLDWLHPQEFDQKNVVIGLGQVLYTPADRYATRLIANDRPYAAALLFGVGYNARSGDRLRSSLLRVGIVGPSALGEQVQNSWHRIIGKDAWRGWSHQLRDEPVIQLVHERLRRWQPRSAPGGRYWDLIGHWGASVGNFATYANAGFEWRIGRQLPDDFGSDPLRPAGENTAPAPRSVPREDWAPHFFASLDARAVARDITLDGNTWKDSHRVDKRRLVADLGVGVSLTYGPWKFALARYQRTREFDGQKLLPVFGSVTVSRRF